MSIAHAIEIAPTTVEHIDSFHACLDTVCRERKYLSLLEAAPLASLREFVSKFIAAGYAMYVALDGERVVGWCDVRPLEREMFAHRGVLGMGVHRDYRGCGLGRRLITATVARAFVTGLERVELDVYADNLPALRLYESLGFVHEGRRRNARKLEGQHCDVLLMGLFAEEFVRSEA